MISRLLETVAGLPARWRGDGRTPPLPTPAARPPAPLDPALSCSGCEAVTELIGDVRRLRQEVAQIRTELENR